jgi:hypothetical protein
LEKDKYRIRISAVFQKAIINLFDSQSYILKTWIREKFLRGGKCFI